MRNLIFLIFFSFASMAFANSLYFTAAYLKEGDVKALETKQHIFLNKLAVIKYRNVHYHLILKKCEEDKILIEHETYFFDGDNKTFLSAGIWSGKFKDQMSLKQFGQKGKVKFHFTVIPTQIKKD